MKYTVLRNNEYQTQVDEAKELVVIDFWAAWCGPCRAMGAVIDEIKEEDAAGVKICKVNVDEEPELSEKFGIRVIPTLVFLKGGKIVFRTEGARTAEQMKGLFVKYQ